MVFRNIKMNFHKILTGYGFYICVMFTTFLCFFTNIYEDYGNGNSYSVISSIMNFKRDFMLNDTAFCSFEIMQKGAGSLLSLFIPIISAFAFVPLVCDEYETKSVRFEIFRSSKREYFMAKFLSAGFCGELAVMMGFALFVLIEFTLFPNISEYETALRSMYEEELGYRFPDFARSGYVFFTAKKMGEMFLYGTFCAVPGIILTSIMHNKYLVMCIPFFLKYGLNQTCVRIQSNAIKNFTDVHMGLLKVSSVMNPDALSCLSQYSEEDRRLVLICSGAVVAVAFVFYIILCTGRLDCSE